MLKQDPRNYQILFLSLFLILGIGTRDWTLRPDLILVVMLTCLVTQGVAISIFPNLKEKMLNFLANKKIENWALGDAGTRNLCLSEEATLLGIEDWKETLHVEREVAQVDSSISQVSTVKTSLQSPVSLLKKKPNHSESDNSDWLNSPQLTSLKSALITALSLSLLLRADRSTTMILAGALAILSKFLFQVESKHFFNPANFGIIAALTLTNDAWVSPGQWGEDGWYALLFAGTGGMVVKRVGRWDTTAAFLGAYALLEAMRNLWLGWTWDVFCHRLMSGSLLLFALFMITDPRSIPNAKISRLIWAGCIAILTFILRNQFFVATSVFWALFALAPLSVVLDSIWSAPRFAWSQNRSHLENGLE
jgi:Na+-transporting NADH:ubiquinone oxidoreductase subunit NqrB